MSRVRARSFPWSLSLPADPVTPISGLPHSRRTAAPRCCNAASVSSTTSNACLSRNRGSWSAAMTAANGASPQRRFDVVVTVQPFALDSEKQVARLNRAGIDGIPYWRQLRDEAAGRAARTPPLAKVAASYAFRMVFASTHILHARALARASSMSSKGTVPSRVTCIFSCPFPAISTISPGLASLIANSIAFRRSGSSVYFVPLR